MTYSPVEISSFIIKKMVQNAENYLHQKITKLVITVPAHFNDSQRKLTKQAAELVGLKVLRIINEPTAPATALAFDFYGNQEINETILVFDLGGGTFDISILSVKKDENYKSFKVLGTSGDTQLGGEDFDNKLVEYFLNKINKLYNEKDWKELNDNKQLIKKLKINCERIKRILNYKETVDLNIPRFFKDIDIIEKVTRTEFEDICEPLFQKIKKSIDKALSNTKLTKNDIQEIILVGGSTRIPKVREIVGDYFPELKKKNKINENINPDEVVAFGATIAAGNILNNKDKYISNVVMSDIIPSSLGIAVINNYEKKKNTDEGNIMEVIFRRGTHFPVNAQKYFCTALDNQTEITFDIYEGENNFIKYNHLLKKITITGLNKRHKGEIIVDVTFDINIDGVLTVKAKEKCTMMEFSIKDDDISLDPEKQEELKEKNKKLLEKMEKNDSSNIDYNNLKDTLRKYNDAYKKCKEDEDDDDGSLYKINFNNTLEKFIDSFGGTFDNETLFEKYYLYVKELFLSYLETLTLEIDRENIVSKMKKYIDSFIDKSSDYLSSLIENLRYLENKRNLKNIFYRIVIYVIEKLNENGEKCILSNKKFCKYYSLNSFELAETYYEKYLSKIGTHLLKANDLNNLKEQKKKFETFIKDINSGANTLCLASFEGGYIFDNQLKIMGRDTTNDIPKLVPEKMNLAEELERIKLILSNYEKILISIQSSNKYRDNTKKEAICIANIIKINIILGQAEGNGKTMLRYADRCSFIIEKQKDESFKNDQWYNEFIKLYEEIKNYNCNKENNEDYNSLFNEIRPKYEDIFNKIDNKFNKKKEPIDFIKFILEKHPYNDYESDKNKKGENFFEKYSLVLVNYLLEKYLPDNFPHNGDEEIKLKYCIVNEIFVKLNNLYLTIQ